MSHISLQDHGRDGRTREGPAQLSTAYSKPAATVKFQITMRSPENAHESLWSRTYDHGTQSHFKTLWICSLLLQKSYD